MTLSQHQVASKDVKPNDGIFPSALQNGSDRDRLAKVRKVTPLGAMVKIETDLGTSEILPVNRSIMVWRESGDIDLSCR